MAFAVKLTCEGTGADRHPRMTMATYEHGTVTGWHRVERFDDQADTRHLPGAEGLASNAPGARFKEKCRRCGRTPELTWDVLVPQLESARVAGKSRVTLA